MKVFLMEKMKKIIVEIINKCKKIGFIKSTFSIIFWLSISSTLLWNWDGFWQTDIKSLNFPQKKYFSSKYNEEQLKISRITRNNEFIDEMNERLFKYEKRYESKLDKAIIKRDSAIKESAYHKDSLEDYLKNENLKCRNYITSLKIIDQLTRKYSKDELEDIIRCTSDECEKIIDNRSAAESVCD